MSRLFAIISIVLMLAVIAQPIPAFNQISESLPPNLTPGYYLNSEGDEWLWADPNQPEPKPPTPPVMVQDEQAVLLQTTLPHELTATSVQAAAAFEIALAQARESGPQAVLAFAANQSNSGHPLLQEAVLSAQRELSSDASEKTLSPEAGERVSLNAGPCSYVTIQEAVNAASNGDTIRVSAGVYSETVDVAAKQIDIQGGYDATCTTFTGGATEVRRTVVPGSVVDVTNAAELSLVNLNLTGGTDFGAGLDVLGASRVTLNNTDIHHNNGPSGGGIYISSSSVVTFTNDSDLYNNTAGGNGGGAIVFGKLVGLTTSADIYNNSAINGAGIAVLGGQLTLDNADVVANTATQLGGGIYVTSNGTITLTNSVFVGETVPCCQSAAAGGGIYANASEVALLGASTAVMNNTATSNGGGIYLTNGANLTVTGGSLGYDSTATAGNDAILGAGVYAITSTVSYSGRIVNNIATNSGGGIYATHSTLNMTSATVGGTGVNLHNQIGAGGLNGSGLYLINATHATINDSTIISNTLSNLSTGYGGGLYVRAGSVVTLTNSSIQEHFLPSAFDGRGAGMYIYDSTVTLDNTRVLSNTATNLGGGARLFGVSILNIQGGSLFQNNQALGGVGGALAATNAPDININNASFLSNSASSSGGAIYLDAGTLDFTGSWDVRSNQSGGSGGALAVVGTGNAAFRATGGPAASYLAENHASADGGAIYTTNANVIALHATSGFPIDLNANSAGGHGGALFANSGALFDIYGQIQATANDAGGNGGMAYLSGGSRLWMDDFFNTPVQVLVNTAANGGAIYASDSPRVECDGAIFGFTNDGNKATNGSGGAIYLSGSFLLADNCIFRHNQAQAGNGGAIAAYTSTVDIDVDFLHALRTTARDAQSASPAAPQATGCDPHTQQCSSLYLNTAATSGAADGYGGAIYANGSSLTIDSSYLHRNTAQQGGAIYQDGPGATGAISNTLIYSNTSILAVGAGLRVSSGTMNIQQATIANNIGGAGYSPGAVQSYIRNSIIWGNTTASASALTLAECNLDQGGVAGPALNPQFVAPGGGEDYQLLAGSPAIDACSTGLPLDLLNTARPQGSNFEMGAFEVVIRHLYLPLIHN